MKLNNQRISIEMTNTRFRLGFIWRALTRKHVNFIGGTVTLGDDTVKEIKLLLKNKK